VKTPGIDTSFTDLLDLKIRVITLGVKRVVDSTTKILNAALQLFITQGFDGTSTAKIVKEAGVSNGTLFYHFKTKEALISKLYVTLKDDYKKYLLEHMGQCQTIKGKIKQLWYSCVDWYMENRDGVTFFNMFSDSPYIDKLSKEESSRNFVFIFELFQEAIDEEIIINVAPDLIMYYFYSSVRAFTNFSKENPNQFNTYQDIAFNMWWRSVANI
jgi:AcrR family transcriptional regulator